MNHYEIQSDRFGYLTDLTEALQNGDSVTVVFAGVRCVIHGIKLDPDTLVSVNTHTQLALSQVIEEVQSWVEAAKTFGRDWLDKTDPWEADQQIQTMIELRTQAEGLKHLIGKPIETIVNELDLMLLPEFELLSTVAETSWFSGYIDTLSSELRNNAWWLKPQPKETVKPSFGPKFSSWVRRVQDARDRFPVVGGVLAADVAGEPHKTVRFRWRSPDGMGEARLNLPHVEVGKEGSIERPLRFSSSGTPLVGIPVRIGVYQTTTDDQGKVLVAIEQLRKDWNGVLFVGSPEVEWELLPETED